MFDKAEIYFKGENAVLLSKILGAKSEPYQEGLRKACVEPGILSKLTNPQKRYGNFVAGKFFWQEKGGYGSGVWIPYIELIHPIRNRILFSTYHDVDLAAQGIRTSEEKGTADFRIEINEENPIGSAFANYDVFCSGGPPMVVYKKPKTLEHEQKIKAG